MTYHSRQNETHRLSQAPNTGDSGVNGICRGLKTNSLLNVICPAAVETRPHGAVEKAKQRLLGGRQLHPQPHQGRLHLHHLQHNVGAAPGFRDQDGGPQEDLQQRQQDRQDVPDSVSCPLWNLQPRLLGHVP